MMLLALDTCLAACSVAVVSDGKALAWLTAPTQKGHQELLAPMVRDVMAIAGVRFGDVERIGVAVGPGSFTGLRVALAFAKGLSLSLGRPCAGVGTLEALAHEIPPHGLTAAIIDAGRKRLYLQLFADGHSLMAADILEVDTALERIAEAAAGREVTLAGPGAALLSASLPGARVYATAAPDPRVVARLAARSETIAARPLYLRPPDALAKAS